MKYTARHRLDTVGDYIWRLRESKNISQRKLHQISGVHHVTIGKVETGLHQYSLHSLLKICNALDITLAHLFTELEL